MNEHLYPTLIADDSLTTPAADNCSTLQKQITSEIDKYLQEAVEKCERDDNYFDGWHMATNTSSPQCKVLVLVYRCTVWCSLFLLQLCQKSLFLLWLCMNIYVATLGNVVRVCPRIVQGLTFLSA